MKDERIDIMEFGEKLKQLRKQINWTQEQLAEQLYVSRAAISKWEGGKGYPNIESLKSISKIFGITIDELLSSEELIDLAVSENRSNINRLFAYMCGLVDTLAIGLILLPLYGQPTIDYIQAVSLLHYTNTTLVLKSLYWIIFILLIALGIGQIMTLRLKKEHWQNRFKKCAFALNSLAIILFAAAREPYVTALLFLMFGVKVILLLKEIRK